MCVCVRGGRQSIWSKSQNRVQGETFGHLSTMYIDCHLRLLPSFSLQFTTKQRKSPPPISPSLASGPCPLWPSETPASLFHSAPHHLCPSCPPRHPCHTGCHNSMGSGRLGEGKLSLKKGRTSSRTPCPGHKDEGSSLGPLSTPGLISCWGQARGTAILCIPRKKQLKQANRRER